MCIVSMVGGEYSKTWPSPWEPGTFKIVPHVETSIGWTPAREATALDLLEQLMDVARRLDAVLGLPDCEDPQKTAWLEEVRARVREHERAKIDARLGAAKETR